MTLTILAEPVPLKTNPNGVVYVGGTRVTLDTVVAVFKQGATAEEIVHRYPSLRLGDVYASIAFYLNHQHRNRGVSRTASAAGTRNSQNQ